MLPSGHSMEAPFRSSHRDEPLRILILATPKTGNVWLKNLLSLAYDLPQKELPAGLTAKELDALGDRWVVHQHLLATSATLQLLRSRGVVVVTLVRHPGDVLVSLKHFVPHSSTTADYDHIADDMLRDGGDYAERTRGYVKQHFPSLLSISLCWMRCGAHVIRYEDLLSDPIGEMTRLSWAMNRPVEARRIPGAVFLSSFDRMKRREKARPHHFRQGRSGGWQGALPQSVVDIFRTQAPFPALFSALGYSCDADENEPVRPFDSATIDPFGGATYFENGVPITDFLVEAYLLHAGEVATRWLDPVETSGSDTFFTWLNRSCNEGANRDAEEGTVTNLARLVHRTRADLQATYPDPLGWDRRDYLAWFNRHGLHEYHLAPCFAAPLAQTGSASASQSQVRRFDNGIPAGETIRVIYEGLGATARCRWPNPLASESPDSFYSWLNGRCDDDIRGQATIGTITNLAHSVHQSRSDLKSTYPDPFGWDRDEYLAWFNRYGLQEHMLAESFAVPQTDRAPVHASPDGVCRFDNGVRVCEVIREIYTRHGAEARGRWPNPLASEAPESFYRWLIAPSGEHRATTSAVYVSNLAHEIYLMRPDVQAAFTAPFGWHHLEFRAWFSMHARREYGLDPAFDLGSVAAMIANPLTRATHFDNGVPVSEIVHRLFPLLDATLAAKWPDATRTGGDSFYAWLNAPVEEAVQDETPMLCVTNLAYELYKLRPDLQRAFSAPLGPDRLDFLQWFTGRGALEYGLDVMFTAPVIEGLARGDRHAMLGATPEPMPSWTPGGDTPRPFAA